MKTRMWLPLVIGGGGVALAAGLFIVGSHDNASPATGQLSPGRKAHTDLVNQALVDYSPDTTDDDTVTFETLNKWQAPLLNFASGGVLVWKRESILQGPRFYNKDSIHVARLLLNKKHMASIKSLVGSQREKLIETLKPDAREVFQDRLKAASILCLMCAASQPKSGSEDGDLFPVSLSPYSGSPQAYSFRLNDPESDPRIRQNGDFFDTMYSGFGIPVLPVKGKVGITWQGSLNKHTVVGRESVVVSGVRFRCFVVRATYFVDDPAPDCRFITSVSWFAPGIGLVYRITVFSSPMDKRSSIRVQKVQEILLPDSKIHWRYADATHK